MEVIARIHSDFPTKFGIPRQSGIVPQLKSTVVFEREYRIPDALRGIEEFSHLWLIWGFSENVGREWSPTVRPPRLGGNMRKGVFATRSPFRPNSLGLSCVKLESVGQHKALGMVLNVSGGDLMDGTPVYDIKPYLPYVDSHPEAFGGFADIHKYDRLDVNFPKAWLDRIPEDRRHALIEILALDPRPSYQNDPQRVYGFQFAGHEIKFQVKEAVLTVCRIIKMEENNES